MVAVPRINETLEQELTDIDATILQRLLEQGHFSLQILRLLLERLALLFKLPLRGRKALLRLLALLGTLRLLQAQSAADPTGSGLLLVVLQIREALDIGRPFASEHEALVAFAKSQPDIASAAAPLAEPAKTGVATRGVLIERLRALSGEIATARPKPAEDDWGARAWAQLRGLVTIRRIEGTGQSAPETAVSAAARALAAGDLPGAIAALDPLDGAAADAARPWVQMARQRLAWSP